MNDQVKHPLTLHEAEQARVERAAAVSEWGAVWVQETAAMPVYQVDISAVMGGRPLRRRMSAGRWRRG
jgi:hypothetical protein